MHEIGKDIAITMLKLEGFEVKTSAPRSTRWRLSARLRKRSEIIDASGLMTSSMPNRRRS